MTNHVAQTMTFIFHMVENIVGKGENASYQHFLLFPQCFPKTSTTGSLKVLTMWYRLKKITSYLSKKKDDQNKNMITIRT